MSDEPVNPRRAFFSRLIGRQPDPPVAPARTRPRPGDTFRPARVGTFAIAEHLCIAWQGTSCSTCRERCPVPGVITVDAGRPTIDPATCTGCGECVAVCPAPILAIRFVARPPPAPT